MIAIRYTMQKNRLKLIALSITLALSGMCYSQNVIKLKKPKVYITSAYSIGVFAGGYLYSKSIKGLSSSAVNSISVNSLSSFDRKAANNYSTTARTLSDISVFSTALLPNLLSLNKNVRSDFLTYNIVYGQALLSTVGQVMLLKSLTKKNRPYLYNPNVSLDEKLKNSARFSFPSGHIAVAATASYFFATTYSLYNPKSKYKKWVWIGATVLPLVTGYFRYEAGKHFVSDLAGGYLIGAANGIVFPLLFRIGK